MLPKAGRFEMRVEEGENINKGMIREYMTGLAMCNLTFIVGLSSLNPLVMKRDEMTYLS
jgi:hypothetical protein